MKNKIIGVLIMLMMFFSVKDLVSAKTITVNDFVNEIEKIEINGSSIATASIDSQNKQVIISVSGSPSMVVNYTDEYIEYNGRQYNKEYYSNHPGEKYQRMNYTYVVSIVIDNLYGDDYEQYGVELEESEVVLDNNSKWSEITYFKLPLNTDNINNGTNNEESNGTTTGTNNETNTGSTTGANNEGNTGSTTGANSEINNGTPTGTNSNVTNEAAKDNNNESDVVTNKTKYNPNTGDNILIYVGIFAVLLIASIITAKKVILNK